jgi:hypothetical protein
MAKIELLIPEERIEKSILLIRGHKVILDRDLATLYGVPTGTLNQAVKRNLKRFPEDFMFQLSHEEMHIWKSQIVISNPQAKMALRKRPYAFTEHGVAMLLSDYSDIHSAPLQMTERPDPVPGTGEVLVRVNCCGIWSCRRDQPKLAPLCENCHRTRPVVTAGA